MGIAGSEIAPPLNLVLAAPAATRARSGERLV